MLWISPPWAPSVFIMLPPDFAGHAPRGNILLQSEIPRRKSHDFRYAKNLPIYLPSASLRLCVRISSYSIR